MNIKYTSTRQRINRIVLLSIVSLALLIAAMLSIFLNDKLSSLNQQSLQQQVTSIHSQIHHYLDARLKELSASANSPLIVQSVMQPKTREGRLSDMMSKLKLQQQLYPMALLNFENSVIISKSHNNDYQAITQKQWQRLQEIPEPSVYLYQKLEQQMFTLMVPVFYQNSMEGALSANIRIKEILTDLNIMQQAKGIELIFFAQQQQAFSLGTPVKGEIQYLDQPLFELSIGYRADISRQNQETLQLLIDIAIAIFLSVLIISLIALNLIKRLTHPLEQLCNQASEISNGLPTTHLHSSHLNTDLQPLVKLINNLHSDVKKKDRQLTLCLQQLKNYKYQEKLHTKQLTLAQDIKKIVNGHFNHIANQNTPLAQFESWHNQVLSALSKQRSAQEQRQIQQVLLKKYQQQKLGLFVKELPSLLNSHSKALIDIQHQLPETTSMSDHSYQAPSLISLNDCIEQCLNLLKAELPIGCELKSSLSEACYILANKEALEIAITDLLHNAHRAIHTHGIIYVRLTKDENLAKIIICDNGETLSKEQQRHLFNPLYYSMTKRTSQLARCYSTIQQFKGSLEFSCETGKGNIFTLTFPLNDPNTVKNSAGQHDSVSLDSLT